MSRLASSAISRRSFVAGALASLAWAGAGRAAHHEAAAGGGPNVNAEGVPNERLAAALATSPYVYVSPLLADGTESRCHGEIWYAWLDGEVVSSTAAGRWKAQAIARGRDRARLWVGDYGRWRGGRNESFREGPSFVARGRRDDDLALLERILDVYARKYPDEIGRWRGRMREEVASGERVLLRYRPVAP